MPLTRRHRPPRLRPSNFAPPRLAGFWTSPAGMKFGGRQSCPFCRLPKSYAGLKRQEELEEFERFEAAYGKAVWEEVLKPRREAKGNRNWQPSWMEGLSYQTQVNKILREQFYAARRVAGVNTPPPKGGGFVLRLKAGSVRLPADSGVTISITPQPRRCRRLTSLAATRHARQPLRRKDTRNDTAAPCPIPCRLKAWGFLIPYRGL
jgi:hypothetical protein